MNACNCTVPRNIKSNTDLKNLWSTSPAVRLGELPTTLTITIHFINPSGKLKLSFDRTTFFRGEEHKVIPKSHDEPLSDSVVSD